MAFQARYDVIIYRNATSVPTTPTGGSYVVSTGVLTPPTDWTELPTALASGENVYESQFIVNPIVDTGTLSPTWSAPIESSAEIAEAAQTAAEAAQTAAETAQTAAETAQTAAETAQTAAETAETNAETAETNAETAETNAGTAQTAAETAQAAAEAAELAAEGYADLVTSYTGPVQIVDPAVSYEASPTDVTVTNWRDYDELVLVFQDSAGTVGHLSAPVLTEVLDEIGQTESGQQQNDRLTLSRTAASDVLSVGLVGWSGHPTTGDTVTVWGLRVGVTAGGGGGGGGGASSFSDLSGEIADESSSFLVYS